MSTSGPNSATAYSVREDGASRWTDPESALTSDGLYATAGGISPSDTLVLSEFEFNLPAGATISGITLEVLCYAEEEGAQLAASLSGSATKAAAIPLAPAYISVGGAADLWGLTWTPADVNSISLDLFVDADTAVYIDHIRLSVTYEVDMPVTVKPTASEVIEEGQLILGYFPNCANQAAMEVFIASRIEDVDSEVQLEVGTYYTGGADATKADLIMRQLHKAEMYLTLGRLWQIIKNVMDGYDAEALPPEFVEPDQAAENRDFYLKEGKAIVDRYDQTAASPNFVMPYFKGAGSTSDTSILETLMESGEL